MAKHLTSLALSAMLLLTTQAHAETTATASTTSPATAQASAVPANATPITAPASAAKASENTVRQLYTALEQVMRQGSELGYAGRYKKLEPVLREAYNLPLMTRFAVGPAWGKATAQEQDMLVSAFSDFSIATYANRFAAYDGEKFEVLGSQTIPTGIMVQTRLTPKGSEPVALNYIMKKDDKGIYRIVDVYLNGTISELATRRAEFSSIAGREGIAALVNAIGQKSKQMGG